MDEAATTSPFRCSLKNMHLTINARRLETTGGMSSATRCEFEGAWWLRWGADERKGTLTIACGLIGIALSVSSRAAVPLDYTGKPFRDSVYTAGAQVIPGKVECAYYDMGGEGVAYHDTDPINHGSGELNLRPEHHRPHATAYCWSFRADEGVDVSYTKDFADFNHTNFVAPGTNQLYIGWTADGEWCNYTVNVKKAGTYRILALYGNAANTIKFSVNHQPASECKVPIATGSMHIWNKAEIGTIIFPTAGLQLLTFHYNKGNNFAYFQFEPADKPSASPRPGL